MNCIFIKLQSAHSFYLNIDTNRNYQLQFSITTFNFSVSENIFQSIKKVHFKEFTMLFGNISKLLSV